MYTVYFSYMLNKIQKHGITNSCMCIKHRSWTCSFFLQIIDIGFLRTVYFSWTLNKMRKHFYDYIITIILRLSRIAESTQNTVRERIVV